MPSNSESADNTGVNTNFFKSRKNLVGIIAAVLVIVIHLAVGLGALWPVVAVAAWGAGAVLTPEKKQKELPKPAVPAPVTLERTLQATLNQLGHANPPREVLDQARVLSQNARFVLAEWDSMESAPDQQQSVWNIIEIYLPEVVTTYLDAPDLHLPSAVDHVLDSLYTLTTALESIKQAILDNNVRALDSQARMLRSKFGNLPGLNGNPEAENG
ncbi:hypothetical protein [Corynebacterium lubricantis]|uniref:hypothetical protein n=1 Tax=Corynebacterium lubricantis TaxID=541095 RepID=UPI0003779C76|nr:hypothetical protein [Corynebacterium lubricantis]